MEHGLFVKHCKVEVYLLELKLCENSDPTNVLSCHFSKADTIGEQLSWDPVGVVRDCGALRWAKEKLKKKKVTKKNLRKWQNWLLNPSCINSRGKLCLCCFRAVNWIHVFREATWGKFLGV